MAPGASHSRSLRARIARCFSRNRNHEARVDHASVDEVNEKLKQVLAKVEESTANLELAFAHICQLIEQHAKPPEDRINKLPVEILCHIFGLCGDVIPAVFDYPRDCVMHLPESKYRRGYPELLTNIIHVCSHWSTVARGCPTLWTLIEMPFPRRRDCLFFRLCLQLSAGLPLTLRLRCIPKETPPQDPPIIYVRSVMQLVANTATRWKEVSVHLACDFGVLDPLRMLPPGAFTALERASILLRGWKSQQPIPDGDLWRILCASPNLRVADFWDSPRRPKSPRIASFPLRNITHLGLNTIRNDELKDILKACPRVEVLQIWLGLNWTPGQPDTYALPMPSSIVLKHLRFLMLHGQRDWKPLYDCLTAPRLDRLDIHGAGVQVDAVKGMLDRSWTKLRMLTLHAIHPDDLDDAANLLLCEHFQELRILRVEVFKPDPIPPGRSVHFDPRPFLGLQAAKCLFTSKFRVAEDAYAALDT